MDAVTFVFSQALLPELTAELKKTRTTLERVPEGHNDFKPHEKSKSLLELANHLATVSGLSGSTLTSSGGDLGTSTDPRRIVKEENPAAILAVFDELAAVAIAKMQTTSDEDFSAPFLITMKGQTMFSGTRYMAFRNIALNHMIHHRSQLGGYLRQLNVSVPYTFGPSADESSPA